MQRERSWVEIDSRALRHNARIIRGVVGKKVMVMAVVKSNAYGHGMVECARILNTNVDWLGVDDLDEALALRKAGITKPILVLGYTHNERLIEAVRKNISVTVSSFESLKTLKNSVKIENSKLKIHLKLETGLNRQGIPEEVLGTSCQVLARLIESGKVKLEGIYSHFAAAELADQKKYRDHCNKQMSSFENMAQLIDPKHQAIWHMGATAATILLPRSHYDMVRVGIGLYGLDPTSDPRLPLLGRLAAKGRQGGLVPALSWYSTIVQVKGVRKGEGIGYDLTEIAGRDMEIAIVPVGYAHGYPRALSGNSFGRLAAKGRQGGAVIVRGKKCRIIGRISMCMTIIDVTNVNGVKSGDTVTLIGAGLSAEAVASRAGTINYELVTRINPELKRIYKS